MIRKHLFKNTMSINQIGLFFLYLFALLLVCSIALQEKYRNQKLNNVNIRFLVKLNKTAAELFRMLKEVYDDECISESRVFKWHKRFYSGRENVEATIALVVLSRL